MVMARSIWIGVGGLVAASLLWAAHALHAAADPAPPADEPPLAAVHMVVAAPAPERDDGQATDADAAAPGVTPPAAAGLPTTFAVRVLDAQDRPWPAADVFALAVAREPNREQRDAMPAVERNLLETFAAARARRFGEHSRADARGFAAVAVEGATTIWAFADGHAGVLQILEHDPMPADGYRIRLTPDPSVAVQVVDHHGAPAPGVPLYIALDDKVGSFDSWGYHPLTNTASPDGTAVLPHVPQWRTMKCWSTTPDPAARRFVRVLLPGIDEPGQPVDCDAAAPTKLVLRLPPTGRIRARVAHGEHGWLDGAAELSLRTEDFWQAQFCVAGGRDGADGWVYFDHVPVGVPMELTALRPHSAATRILLDRPDQTLDVVLQANAALTRGQVVDTVGTPIADCEGSWLRSAHGNWSWMPFRTDAFGRFAVVLPTAKEAAFPGLHIELRPGSGPPLRCELPPNGRLAAGGDLGRLVARPLPLLAAGRVVGLATPWRGAVQLVCEHGNEDAAAPWAPFAARWIDWGAGGAFALYSDELPAAPLRLRAVGADLLPMAPRAFRPGATDLTLHVEPGHRLTVSALVPEGMPKNCYAALEATQDGGAGPLPTKPASCQPHHLDDTDTRWLLSWRALPAGTYTLRIGHAAFPEPLLEVRGLRVPVAPGGDPQLAPIDLRERLQRIRIDVTSAAGGAVRLDGEILVEPTTPRAVWSALGFADGTACCCCRSGPCSCRLAWKGTNRPPSRLPGPWLPCSWRRGHAPCS